MRKIRNFAVFASLIALSAGCQSSEPTISLEEAKQITAKFGGDFTPPPRSVGELVESVPRSALATYNCAYKLPLSWDQFQKIMATMSPPKSGKPGRVGFAEDQAEKAFELGNLDTSVRYMQAGLRGIPNNLKGFTVSRTARLATLLAYAGEFEEASAAIRRASSLLSSLRNVSSWPQRNRDYVHYLLDDAQAAVALSRGRLEESEALYRRALQTIAPYGWPRANRQSDFTRIELATNLMRQGRLLEAENALRDVLRLKNTGEMKSMVAAKTFARLSAVFLEQGRYADAEETARVTVKLYEGLCAEKGSIGLASARDALASALAAQGRWSDALQVYDEAKQAMAENPRTYQRLFSGGIDRGIALIRANRIDEAMADLGSAYETSAEQFGADSYRTAELLGVQAMARASRGEVETALDGFQRATQVLLSNSDDPDVGDTGYTARDRRLSVILGAYIDLLARIRGTQTEKDRGIDAAQVAFRLAEAARSRSVQRALAASSARAALRDPELSELARREQDTRKRIAVLQGALATILDQGSGDASPVRAEIAALTAARRALKEEILTRFPDYAELVNPPATTPALSRAMLAAGEALIVTFTGQDRLHVWAVPRQGKLAFASVEIGRKELARRVNQIRQALEPSIATLGDIPAFDVDAAHGLYEAVLAPVSDGWRDASSLLIVADGPLGHLPFSLLPTAPVALTPETAPLFSRYKSVPWLARSHAVTVLPSVATLRALRGTDDGAPGTQLFAGFGDPWFSQSHARSTRTASQLASRGVNASAMPVALRAGPGTGKLNSANLALLQRLPETAAEVRAMATALGADPQSTVFVGRDASEGRVKSMDLSDTRVITFATHGLVPGELDGLTQPALAFTAPELAGDTENDGLLTMGEVLGLRLNAEWVVLSACNTGAGGGAGAEAVSGLGRAFFYAGAKSLLVSYWPVHSDSTALLTTTLFDLQAKNADLDRAEALRRTRVQMIDEGAYKDAEGNVVFSYAHPIFWAPFTVVGDNGSKGSGDV